MNQLHLTFLAIASSLLLLTPAPANLSHGVNSDRLEPQFISQLAPNLPDKIEGIARQITVRIDSKNDSSASGVIIARQGDNYYVLTAAYVVDNPEAYTVVTPDGKEHSVQAKDIVRADGLDAAILRFTSDRTYAIATLANYHFFRREPQWIFFSGFSANTEKFLFNPGTLFSREESYFRVKDSFSLTNGYELVFTNLSEVGMGGGPLLDTQGRVIGIGGRQEGEVYSSKLNRDIGYALGVPIAAVLKLVDRAKIKLSSIKIETDIPSNLTASQANEIRRHPSFTLEKPPADADENYWLNYGNHLWRLGRYEEAVVALQQAIEKNPEFYQAYYVLGLVQQSQRKYEESVASFQKVTQLNPDYYQAWREQSESLVELRKYPEALTAIDKAIELNSEQATDDNPKDFILEINKENILQQLKRYSETEDVYNEAIKIQPNSEITYYKRGLLHYELEDYTQALAALNQAIKLRPDYAEAYLYRGDIRYRLKDDRGAIADLQTAAELYGS